MRWRARRAKSPAAGVAVPDEGRALPEMVEVVAVVLLAQVGLGLLSALGLLVVALFSGGLLTFWWALLLAIGGPAVLLWCVRGLRRGRRRARNVVLLYEALIVVNAAVRLGFDREVAVGLVVTMTTVALPLAVSGLLLTREMRVAFARPRRVRRARRRRLLVGPQRRMATVPA